MKTLKLISATLLFLISSAIHSQISINVNIGSQPTWGPVGYTNVNYYYLPDIEAYFDIRASQFIYFSQGIWVHSVYLPRQYRNYDLYNGYKVVLNNYHGHSPYQNFSSHKVIYYKGYHGKPQKNIGRRDNDRRYENEEHDNGKHENKVKHHKKE